MKFETSKDVEFPFREYLTISAHFEKKTFFFLRNTDKKVTRKGVEKSMKILQATNAVIIERVSFEGLEVVRVCMCWVESYDI